VFSESDLPSSAPEARPEFAGRPNWWKLTGVWGGGAGPPRGLDVRAHGWCVQLRHPTKLTSEEYVTQKGWLQASLDFCPCHPGGGCGFARHGTYARSHPEGMRIARWYCRDAGMTFSVLPDCMAARVVGSLDEVEQVALAAESRGIEAAAQDLRTEIDLPGAMRWIRRRRDAVRIGLLALITAMPGRLGTIPRIQALRVVIENERALVALREIGADHLQALSYPLGFCRPQKRRSERDFPTQHKTGPDPPNG